MFYLCSIYRTWLKKDNDSYDEIIIFNMNIVIFICRHVKKKIMYWRRKAKKVITSNLQNTQIAYLKGHCQIFLSAIYQLFIKYFNIK